MARFYITTSIVYTNASPHIGFALELVQADAIARWRRMQGDEVFFVTGTDEHGTKIMRSAEALGVPPKDFVDRIAGQVAELAQRLAISNTAFVRTSDREHHWPAAQKIWSKLAENADLYKKSYEGAYCVGHEAFVKPSELIDGLCPLHKTKPEMVQEENWFFKLTNYVPKIRELIESDTLKIVPATKKAELLNLLDDAEDVSFSRPSSQLSWGVPVPGDDTQTMYVWADALTNYLSALGYGTDEANMAFWPAQIHLVGKDITRFHAMIWPAILLAAGLELPKAIYVHGFITVDGQKMSKSLGNVVDPFEVLRAWPADVIRQYMLRELQSSEDGDFSSQSLSNRYTSDLANGLGNLVQRTLTLVRGLPGGWVEPRTDSPEAQAVLDDTDYHEAFMQFRLHDAVSAVWEKIGLANAYLNSTEPWKKGDDERSSILASTLGMVVHVAVLLKPIMPGTSDAILARIESKQIGEPLFPRR